MGYSGELSHHGIPNMKWGQRRFQYEDGTLTPAGRERYRKKKSGIQSKKPGLFEKKKTEETTQTPSRKPISEMSDDELRNLISRAQLEQQYKQFVESANPKKHKSVVSEILGSAAKDVAKTYTKRIMTTGIDYSLEKLGINLKQDGSKNKDKKGDD